MARARPGRDWRAGWPPAPVLAAALRQLKAAPGRRRAHAQPTCRPQGRRLGRVGVLALGAGRVLEKLWGAACTALKAALRSARLGAERIRVRSARRVRPLDLRHTWRQAGAAAAARCGVMVEGWAAQRALDRDGVASSELPQAFPSAHSSHREHSPRRRCRRPRFLQPCLWHSPSLSWPPLGAPRAWEARSTARGRRCTGHFPSRTAPPGRPAAAACQRCRRPGPPSPPWPPPPPPASSACARQFRVDSTRMRRAFARTLHSARRNALETPAGFG